MDRQARRSSPDSERSRPRVSCPTARSFAIGTAHFDARDTIVVQTSLADGTTSLDAVVTHPCEVRPLD